jgi:putative glutamine amidotransferase
VSEVAERRPLIAIPAGNRPDREGMPRLAVNRSYVTALQEGGADVVLLPPGPVVAGALLDRLEGIVFPGGGDVNPKRFGETPREGTYGIDDDLDALELALMGQAVERRLPVLAICRGQQLVNVALGGTLYQDIRRDGLSDFQHATPQEKGRDFLAHAIDVTAGSRLAELLGATRLDVNSFHHQAVRRVAPGLIVTATSSVDGVIEGMESPDGRIVTIQCHPEELTAHAWARALFSGFVAVAAGAAPART